MKKFEDTVYRGIEALLTSHANLELGDRTQYVGSSDISGCLLRAYLSKTAPVEHQNGTLVNFLRGHIAEQVVVRALGGKFNKLTHQFEAVHPAKPYLRAHIDVVFGDVNNGRVSILEIKSTASELPNVPYEGWTRQLIYQMALIQAINPDAVVHGAILGFNIVKPEIRLYQPLEASGIKRQMEAMISRAERLYQALQSGEVDYTLAEPGVLCTYCSYRGNECRVNTVDGDGVLDLTSLSTLIDEYQTLKEQSDSISQRMGEIRQTILDFMGDAEYGKSNGYLVERKVVISNRLDTNGLKKAHPEIYEKFAKQVESVRLTIKQAEAVDLPPVFCKEGGYGAG